MKSETLSASAPVSAEKHPECALCAVPDHDQTQRVTFGPDTCSGGFVKLVLHGKDTQSPVWTLTYELTTFNHSARSAIVKLLRTETTALGVTSVKQMIEQYPIISGSRRSRDEKILAELSVGSYLVLSNPGLCIETRLKLPIAHISCSHVLSRL